MKHPIIFLMGVSGSGKSTVMKALLNEPSLQYVPSVTTRPMREGEEQGRPYVFIRDEQFRTQIASGDFLEYALVHQQYYYGTRLSDLESVRSAGKSPIKEIEINGLEIIQKNSLIPGAYVTIFLDIDDITMTARILSRQPDIDADELQKRLQSADYERQRAQELCDHMIDASKDVYEVIDSVLEVVRGVISGGEIVR